MDGPQPEAPNYDSLSIEDKLSHKAWSGRQDGYIALAKSFRLSASDDDPVFDIFNRDAGLIKRAVCDAHAAAQERALECVLAYLTYGPAQATARSRETVVTALVEKCLGSARAGTKLKAIELALAYVEVDDGADGVIADLTPGLKAKQPKTVAATAAALKEIVKYFGVKGIFAPKVVLALLPSIFEHPDKNVRAEGTLLVQELHRFSCTGLDAALSSLKPIQTKELSELLATMDSEGSGKGSGRATRLTRAEQRQRTIRSAEQALEGFTGLAGSIDERAASPAIVAAAEEEEDSDEWETAEPVDVLAKIPENFETQVVAVKWDERKAALEPVLAAAKVVRIKPLDYSPVMRLLAGRIKSDSQYLCLQLSAQCIQAFAAGLRSDFAPYRPIVMPPLFEKLKEKKQSILDAVTSTLDAIALITPLFELLPDLATYIKHKVPAVKEQTARLIGRTLAKTLSLPSPGDTKTLAALLVNAMEDSCEPLRAAAAEALGILLKLVGERPLAATIDGLDDIRKKKVRAAHDEAVIAYKGTGAKSAPAVAPAARAQPVRAALPPSKATSTLANKENVAPAAKSNTGDFRSAPVARPTQPTAIRPAVKAVPAMRPAASKSSAPAIAAKPVEPLRFKFSADDVEPYAQDNLPQQTVAGFSSAAWKDRVEALTELEKLVKEQSTLEAEAVVRILSKKPGWKESNIQVWAKMLAVFQSLTVCETFSKACIALTVSHVSEKLSEAKHKAALSALLTTYAEKTSLQYVLGQAYEPFGKLKAPKAQADALAWVDESLRDFGIDGISLRELIEYLKTGLKSANAAVRANAQKAVVTLRLYVGPDLRSRLEDLNATLLAALDSEFAKVAEQPPPEPTRFSAESQGPSKAAAPSLAQLDAEESEAIPRVALDKLIPASALAQLDDANWKVRKEQLEIVQQLLNDNPRLQPSLGGLPAGLKLRLSDSNRVVQLLALSLLAKLAIAVGKPFERHCKIFAPPVLAATADAKVSEASLAALSAMSESCGLAVLLPAVTKAFENPNPSLRKELLDWLQPRSAAAQADLKPLVAPILACCEDRAPEVRKSAQALLPAVVSAVGPSYVHSQTTSMKPATRSTLAPLIDAAAASSNANAEPLVAAPPALVQISPVVKSPPRSPTPGPVRSGLSTRPASMSTRPPRASLTSGLAPPAQSSFNEETAADLPCFASGNADDKLARATRDVGFAKWGVDGPSRADLIDSLKQALAGCLEPTLYEKLFRADHHSERDTLLGLDLLIRPLVPTENIMQRDRATFLANADLLYKYITLRLASTSTSIILRCFDLFDALLSMTSACDQTLSDYEVSVFMPSLVIKIGDGKETTRQRVHTVIKSICTLHPNSKIFTTLLEHGLENKNSRVRSETLEEVGHILQRNGISVCQPARALPRIAVLIEDKDSTTRSAALTVLAIAYPMLGDTLWSNVGKLSDKSLSLLEEKLKRTPTGLVSRGQSSSSAPSTPSRNPTRAINGTPASIRQASVLPGSSNRMPSVSRAGSGSLPNSGAVTPQRRQSVQTERAATGSYQETIQQARQPDLDLSDMDTCVDCMLNQDPQIRNSALKAAAQIAANRPAEVLPYAEVVAASSTRILREVFEDLSDESPLLTLKGAKYVLTLLNSMFDKAILAQALTVGTLTSIMAELIRRLLETEPSVAAGTAIAGLHKTLNTLLIRVLLRSERTVCFGALLALLLDAAQPLRDLEGVELELRAAYAELAMKCTWRITKGLEDDIKAGRIDVSQLLLDVHLFMSAIGQDEWRRRAADGVKLADGPQRAVKTIIATTLRVLGTSVFQQTLRIPDADSSPVLEYLTRQATAAKLLTQPLPVANGVVGQASSEKAQVDPHLEAERQELKRIFDRIGAADTHAAGIAELYDFKQSHPGGAAQEFLDKTQPHFQKYIARAMSNLADRREQERLSRDVD
ncbi:uncharacterized protein L969DRAFT_20384 [Mixia osmundae IAM 14324]|uniref:TOG domain-containing protein n=1 Tax=Mixia osmundae (strain CBS 9802 / IAM 14324 / JCM 22182 / KY 12970) TaxID=764103 RepID=G7DVG8_MIXOS|nr:uncharacterized protein L969DRAFT_20384 [Mixia osmundae IAM 14324]KEI36368.1 hypothetical protein L969DRAFT_20384 [Mixia osmundae IAM 14324]GAA94578.1 hypothetical protein E5Q_01230 [Mixia osmundae IAM 14324]